MQIDDEPAWRWTGEQGEHGHGLACGRCGCRWVRVWVDDGWVFGECQRCARVEPIPASSDTTRT